MKYLCKRQPICFFLIIIFVEGKVGQLQLEQVEYKLLVHTSPLV